MIYNQNAITLLQKGHNTRILKDAIVTKLTEKIKKNRMKTLQPSYLLFL